MSLYTVEIGDRIYRVDLSSPRKTVNGEPVDAEVVQIHPNGLYLLRRRGRAVELFLNHLDGETLQVLLRGGQRILSRVAGRNVARGRQVQAEKYVKALTAPMHGLVVEVLVAPGDTVEKNQTLVVLESMKMQMQLRSPRTGQVKQVFVAPGRQVEKGAELVQFAD